MMELMKLQSVQMLCATLVILLVVYLLWASYVLLYEVRPVVQDLTLLRTTPGRATRGNTPTNGHTSTVPATKNAKMKQSSGPRLKIPVRPGACVNNARVPPGRMMTPMHPDAVISTEFTPLHDEHMGAFDTIPMTIREVPDNNSCDSQEEEEGKDDEGV